MDTESFYGVELSEKERLVQFEVASADKGSTVQELIIKQITLGDGAKNDEFNVVQVEIHDEKEPLKIPIAVLKAGETRVLHPNLEFCNDSITFKLIQGSGPVYLCGKHLVSDIERGEWRDDVGGDGCVDEEEDEEGLDGDEDCDEDNGPWPPQQQNGKSRKK